MTETGPPYPPAPVAGSNGLGEFALGISSIGTISSFNIWDTVISQYANSPILDAIILSLAAAIDQTQDFDAFYDNIWNVDTAIGYGLDIWGRIVGVERALHVAMGSWFGFAEASPGSSTFGQDAFWSGVPDTSNYEMPDLTYRQVILAKAAANISDGSIPSINRILRNLFPNEGNAYVTEGNAVGLQYFGFAEAITASGFGQQSFYETFDKKFMTMTYTFNFPLSPVQLAIVQQSGVLPKPVGVAATIVQL